jgi:hypothetical protein
MVGMTASLVLMPLKIGVLLSPTISALVHLSLSLITRTQSGSQEVLKNWQILRMCLTAVLVVDTVRLLLPKMQMISLLYQGYGASQCGAKTRKT